jgi:hypothetical protein
MWLVFAGQSTAFGKNFAFECDLEASAWSKASQTGVNFGFSENLSEFYRTLLVKIFNPHSII